MDINITYYKKPITRNMILTDQITAPKHCICKLGLSTRWGTVNTKEHCSYTARPFAMTGSHESTKRTINPRFLEIMFTTKYQNDDGDILQIKETKFKKQDPRRRKRKPQEKAKKTSEQFTQATKRVDITSKVFQLLKPSNRSVDR